MEDKTRFRLLRDYATLLRLTEGYESQTILFEAEARLNDDPLERTVSLARRLFKSFPKKEHNHIHIMLGSLANDVQAKLFHYRNVDSFSEYVLFDMIRSVEQEPDPLKRIREAREAMKQLPSQTLAFSGAMIGVIGNAYASMGELQKAADALEGHIDILQKNDFRTLVIVLYKLKDERRIRSALAKDSRVAIQGIASALESLSLHREALKYREIAAFRGIDEARSIYKLARAYRRVGRIDEIREVFARLRPRSKDGSVVHNAISATFFLSLHQCDMHLRMAKALRPTTDWLVDLVSVAEKSISERKRRLTSGSATQIEWYKARVCLRIPLTGTLTPEMAEYSANPLAEKFLSSPAEKRVALLFKIGTPESLEKILSPSYIIWITPDLQDQVCESLRRGC